MRRDPIELGDPERRAEGAVEAPGVRGRVVRVAEHAAVVAHQRLVGVGRVERHAVRVVVGQRRVGVGEAHVAPDGIARERLGEGDEAHIEHIHRAARHRAGGAVGVDVVPTLAPVVVVRPVGEVAGDVGPGAVRAICGALPDLLVVTAHQVDHARGRGRRGALQRVLVVGRAGRQGRVQLRPGRALVGGAPHLPAAVEAGGVVGPAARGRQRTHLEVAPRSGGSDYRRPGDARIGGAPHVAEACAPPAGRREQGVGRVRIDYQCADGRVPEIGAAIVGPAGAAVGGLHDAHAVDAGAVEVARAHVDRTRIDGVQRDAARLQVGPPVAQGRPVRAAVRGLPDAAAGRGQVAGARMPGIIGHRVDAAAQLALAVEEAVGRGEVARAHELPLLTQAQQADAAAAGADARRRHPAPVRRRGVPLAPVHAVVREGPHLELVEIGLQVAAGALGTHLAELPDGARHLLHGVKCRRRGLRPRRAGTRARRQEADGQCGRRHRCGKNAH